MGHFRPGSRNPGNVRSNCPPHRVPPPKTGKKQISEISDFFCESCPTLNNECHSQPSILTRIRSLEPFHRQTDRQPGRQTDVQKDERKKESKGKASLSLPLSLSLSPSVLLAGCPPKNHTGEKIFLSRPSRQKKTDTSRQPRQNKNNTG